MEVREVVYLRIQMEGLEAPVAVNQVEVDDIGVLRAQYPRHRTKRPWYVSKDHAQPSRSARALAPGKVQPIRIHSARKRVAADDVNLDLLILAAQ